MLIPITRDNKTLFIPLYANLTDKDINAFFELINENRPPESAQDGTKQPR